MIICVTDLQNRAEVLQENVKIPYGTCIEV